MRVSGLRLWSDKDLWQRLRTTALQSVQEEYGDDAFNSVVAAEVARNRREVRCVFQATAE